MNSSNEAVAALKNLIAASVKEKEVFTTVAASRAVLTLMYNSPELSKTEEVMELVEGIEDRTALTASLCRRHLISRWQEHIAPLNWFDKLMERKNRSGWIDLERETLKVQAKERVRAVLYATYPEGLSYPQFGQIFTHGDLAKMQVR